MPGAPFCMAPIAGAPPPATLQSLATPAAHASEFARRGQPTPAAASAGTTPAARTCLRCARAGGRGRSGCPFRRQRCRLERRSRSSRSGCSFASGSRLAAASMAMIFSPFLIRDAAELHVVTRKARLGDLHRRDETQELLDGEVGAAPIRQRASRARLGLLQQLEDRSADQVRGGLACRRPAAGKPSPPFRAR